MPRDPQFPDEPSAAHPERSELDYPPGTLIDRARAAGISITKRRRAIIQVLEAAALADRRLTSDEVAELAQQIEPELGKNAVFLALRRLRHAGLIERRYLFGTVTYAMARSPAANEAEINAMKWFGLPVRDATHGNYG